LKEKGEERREEREARREGGRRAKQDVALEKCCA
jgi:hypothetical protein